MSTASVLRPQKLGGRPFHTLSQNETWVALLALYHPNVWDIHEQRVLLPMPSPHPLQGHPRALGKNFKPYRGTLEVAQKMGMLSKHPKCRVTLNDGSVAFAPFPYLGDLLLFMQDADGAFVVNHNIKDKRESFRRRGPKPGKPDTYTEHIGTVNRHALETCYYEDAGIPTRQVVGREIDLDLRINLNELFLSHAEHTGLSDTTAFGLLQMFRANVGSKKDAYIVIQEASETFKLNLSKVRTVLMQSIWHRQIQVDLFKPLLMDRPLKPMVDDPLQVYKDWFARG